MPQLRDLFVGGVKRRKPRGHRFERGPHLDHLYHFALRLADDVDTAPRNGANEPFLFEKRQRLTNGSPADAQRSGELPLVQPQFLIRIVDIGVRDRILQERISLMRKLVEFRGASARGAVDVRCTSVAIVFIGSLDASADASAPADSFLCVLG